MFQEIAKFVDEYNDVPTKEVLSIEVEKRKDINEDVYKQIHHLIDHLDGQPVEFDWLVDTTEKWCRDRAIYLALIESIQIADGQNDKKQPDAPSILSDALVVSFDNHVGHDYLLDYSERYDLYNTKEETIPFDLEFFNKITKGGLSKQNTQYCFSLTLVLVNLCLCVMSQQCVTPKQERTIHHA